MIASFMLGAASGSIVGIILDDLIFFIILGTVTGLLTGLMLYDKDMQSSHNKCMQPDPAKPGR